MLRGILKFLGRGSDQREAPRRNEAATKIGALFELVERTQDDGNGRGFIVRRCSDGQLLSWTTLPRKQGIESINVVGEAHRLDEVQNSAFEPGSRVQLVPEPSNPFDPNAVAVWSSDRAFQVGYIPRTEAVRIKRKLERTPHDAFVLWETRDGGLRVNVRLLLVREGVELSAPRGRFVRPRG